MGLIIEQDINLSDVAININPLLVEQGVVIAEKDSSLRMYYIHNNITSDKTSLLDLANYGALAFKDIMQHLTRRAVSRIGIKTFPGIGSYGFFKYKFEERSMIMCPINNNQTQFDAPAITMLLEAGNKLRFTIVDPAPITYQCYRIIMRNTNFAIEYITYDNVITLPKPDVNGIYEIYCIGYVNEGEYISYDSNILRFTVSGAKTSFEPDPNISYYTKAEIEELIKALIPKTYVGDNETIDVNQDTGVITVNEEYRKIIEASGGGNTSYIDNATATKATYDMSTACMASIADTIDILED